MTQAKKGDTVKVHYTGKLEDGTVFDSSRESDPLEFEVGSGQLIAGFDETVDGMIVGDTRSITIPPEKAYGDHREELTLVLPIDRFPADFELEIGQQLQSDQEDGPPIILTVVARTETDVTLDGNHPLAGKELTFDIELMEIA